MRFHLPILFALSAVVHVGIVANSSLTARDSLGFARQGMNLVHPERGGFESRLKVLRETQQPPGYPAVVYSVYCAVSICSNVSVAEQLLLSTQLASAIAGILIAYPFYRLGRCLLEPSKAFAASAIYQLLPAMAKYTSDGLSESLFLLLTVTALWLTVSGLREPRRWRFLLAGFSIGCAYLVRPEGLALGLAVAGTLAIMAVSARRKVWIVSAFFVSIGIAMLAAPYMVAIGGVTNKPAGKGLYETQVAAHAALFAEFIPPANVNDRMSRAGWCVKAAGIEFLRATHYSVGILAFVTLCLFGSNLLREPGWFVLIAYGSIQLLAVFIVAGFRHGYISDRHMLPLVPVTCLFAMRTLSGLPHWWVLISMAIGVSCIPSLIKPLHDNRVGHKHAGRFLAGALQETDDLIDPFEWAGFYSGRTVCGHPNPKVRPTAMFAVLDDAKGENPHARLQHMPEALQISRDPRSELVFTWPTNATGQEAKVRVYRLKTYR